MTQLRLGIIGVGGFGLFALKQYCRLPQLRVTAIAGTRPEKYAALAKEFDIPFHTTDWRALVSHPEVDVVYLATPPNTRAEMALAALEAGKHVFCEKPLALSLPDADRMLDAAQQAGLRLGINFVMRYSTLYELARAVVTERIFGAPRRFVFENNAGDLPAGHWFWDPQRSGGILVEHGVHFFDIAAAIFGDGNLCWAGMSRRESGAEDRWLCIVQYAERMFGSFYHAFDKPSEIEHTGAVIEFEQGTLSLDGWLPTGLSASGLLSSESAELAASLLPGAEITPLPEPQKVLANGSERVVSHRLRAEMAIGDKQDAYAAVVQAALTDFLAWVRESAHHPRVTGADARAALSLSLAATALARETSTSPS